MLEDADKKAQKNKISSLLSVYSGNGIVGLLHIILWAVAAFIGLKRSKDELDQKEKDMLIWAETLKRQHQQENK